MTKDEMVDILKEHGYPAENVDGVVYVHKALSKQEARDMAHIIRRAGYRGSHGCRRQPEGQRKR